MSVINLGRTTKTNIVFYQTDGMGRDGYITYNNGGFWKNRQIKLRDVQPRKKITLFRSLFHQPAPFTYISDGSGRDSYVIEHNGGLVKSFQPLTNQQLPKFLRKNEDDDSLIKHKLFLTKSQRRYLNKIKKIQDGVVHRLYQDSLEKIKKNNIKYRNKSLNDLFISKEKINSLTCSMAPNTELQNNKNISLNQLRQIERQNIENQSNTSLHNNLSPKKSNIFEKIVKNKTIYKDNSTQNLGIFNSRNFNNINNRKIRVLKKIRINSQPRINRTLDDAMNEKNNIYNFGSKYPIEPINNRKIFGNNTLGYSSTNNLNKIKFNYDIRKINDNIKNDASRNEDFNTNDLNKNSDYRYE
jgi:hypothetical protein